MRFLPEDDNLTIIVRFARAAALALFALVALGVTLAMFWRDAAVSSFFDNWFGEWSEPQLTALAGLTDLAMYGALRMTQRSEDRYRRSRSR